MTSKLKDYFPMVREREEVLSEINRNEDLKATFRELSSQRQKELLDFCTGMRGVKLLYDSFFKEVMNPEYAPERLESFLSVILKRQIRIVKILPNDSTRIADESSLLVTDVIVELENGAYANVEVQKIGYAFPGARSACYSSDMMLRQYKRVRARQGKKFSYSQIKNVYLIIIYEKSPKELREIPNTYYHHSKQIFDSGLQMDMLQEYVMISLDTYHKRLQNRNIETKLEAWLTFLSDDSPERIIELITKFPEFKPMYETLYQMCLNTEKVMDMFFSEELRILDRNTVQYMIEEQQKELDEQKETLKRQRKEINQQKETIGQQRAAINQQKETIDQQKAAINQKNEEISHQKEALNRKDDEIVRLKKELEEFRKKE